MQPTDPRGPGQGAHPRALRLVHPAPPKPVRRKGSRPPPLWTADECARLRAALRNARTRFGSWQKLADAMGVTRETIQAKGTGRKPLTAEIAVRLAKAVRVPLDALLRPPTDTSICPYCGTV